MRAIIIQGGNGSRISAENFHNELERLWKNTAIEYKVSESFTEAVFCGLSDSLIYAIKINDDSGDREVALATPQILEMVIQLCGRALNYDQKTQISPVLLTALRAVTKLLAKAAGGTVKESSEVDAIFDGSTTSRTVN